MSNVAPFSEAESDRGLRFAMDALQRIPKDGNFEAHLTGMLIVFWGALWGSFGTDYARDFIQAQLQGMESGGDLFVSPPVQ